MKKAVPMILSEDNFKQIFAFAEQYSKLAKALYNAALFRIRQVFTGWDKKDNLMKLSVRKRLMAISPVVAFFPIRR